MRLILRSTEGTGLANMLTDADGRFQLKLWKSVDSIDQFVDEPGTGYQLWLGENPHIERAAWWNRIGFRTGTSMSFGANAELTFRAKPPGAS